MWFAQNSLPLRWQRQPQDTFTREDIGCDLLKIHYLCGDKDNASWRCTQRGELWFAQNSLPLRWQRQQDYQCSNGTPSCDLLKIHYLCGDKDNVITNNPTWHWVVICSKFITFAVTKTTTHCFCSLRSPLWFAQNSLPLRWQRQQHPVTCARKGVVICSKFITSAVTKTTCRRPSTSSSQLWFAQNSLPLRWQRQLEQYEQHVERSCDLLKIHYLCGDKDNDRDNLPPVRMLWFAQNSLPLRWQRQLITIMESNQGGCDLLKIHYLCGDKDNTRTFSASTTSVVICSKFITFAVTKTTSRENHDSRQWMWLAPK